MLTFSQQVAIRKKLRMKSHKAKNIILSDLRCDLIIHQESDQFFFENVHNPFLKNNRVQTELTTGWPNDKCEQKIDALADKLVRMPKSDFLQCKCAQGDNEENILRKPYSSSFVLFFKRHMVTQANPISQITSQLTSVSTIHVQPTEMLTQQQCISYV